MLRTQHSSDDLQWMKRALTLAREMRGKVWPNPPVGCVIVKDGIAVAETATHAGGRPHAERKALDQAGSMTNEATLYVTLEPCCHWGKTPPCADAIIEAGVSRVVCAIRDPDPRVNGGGFIKLKEAGISLSVGVCAEEAEQIMSGFFNRIRFGVPEVIVLSDALDGIPDGIDALIRSTHSAPQLISRTGEIDIVGIKPHQLLNRLGKIGLTSVAVQDRDPLISVLAPARTDVRAETMCNTTVECSSISV